MAAPTDILVIGGLVNEQAKAGTVVATLAVVDADVGDTFTFTLTEDASGFFEIVDNEIRVRAGANIDFETLDTHVVAVAVTDSTGNIYSEPVTLQVLNINEITGTELADVGTIDGTIGDDIIDALGGNDTVNGFSGSDTIFGGAGSDQILGGFGNDVIEGGTESDSLGGEQGNDTLRGGDGCDGLNGGVGDDVLEGGADGDSLVGDTGSDTLIGGAGNDSLNDVTFVDSNSDNNLLDGGAGTDSLFARNFGFNSTPQTIVLDGGTEDDSLFFQGYGNATLLGGEGNDSISATSFGTGTFTVDGGAGNDTISFSGGPGTVDGGAGNDTINFSGSGTVDGGAGSDVVTLSGTATVTLGSEQDTLSVDAFSQVIVTDFATGAGGDKLALNQILNSLVGYDGSNPFGTGYLRLTQDGSDTLLEIDLDGAGAVNSHTMLLRLQNTTAANFTSDNFTPPFPPAGGQLIVGGPNIDNLVGGPGNDEIFGFADNDVLAG